MKLICLGSSSKGNCYILESEKEALIIECGIPLREVKKTLNFNVGKIVAAIISHEHGDHAAYINDFTKATIDVYCSRGTAMNFNVHHRLHRINAGSLIHIGEFKVLPFDVRHDAAEPLGFLINHPESGNVLFLTDSFYSEFTFKDLNNIILEVNYDKDILEENIISGRLNKKIKNRIITSHMSLDTAKELLAANDLSKVNNIILIHLSDGNSHAVNFKKDIESATGKTITVADSGTEILLNKTPF